MTDEPPLMPCDHPDCHRESTHSSSVWRTPDHLEVLYWCSEHAPDDADQFDEPDDMPTVGVWPPVPDDERIKAGILRPDSDFVPLTPARRLLMERLSLHINTMPDDMVDRFNALFAGHYGIKPLRSLDSPCGTGWGETDG